MKGDTQQFLLAYIAATLKKMPNQWGAPRVFSGMDVVEALWPLNDIFRPYASTIGELPYETRYEADADTAIENYVAQGAAAWKDLPAGVWRVLMERQQQALVTGVANETAGNQNVMTVPKALPEAAILNVAMIYMMHGMTLPFPVQPRPQSVFQQGDTPVKYLLN